MKMKNKGIQAKTALTTLPPLTPIAVQFPVSGHEGCLKRPLGFVYSESSVRAAEDTHASLFASMRLQTCLASWFCERATVETIAVPRATIVFTTVCRVNDTATVHAYTTNDMNHAAFCTANMDKMTRAGTMHDQGGLMQ